MGAIDELQDSMKTHGLLQPILVRKASGGRFEVIAGHRRYLAAKQLDWSEIAANTVDVDDKTAYELALMENIQRKTMDVVEEARAFNDYIHARGYGSIKQLAAKIGVSEKYISNRIVLLPLPPKVLGAIQEGKMTLSHGAELTKLSKDSAEKMAQEIQGKGLNTDTTKRAVELVNYGFNEQQATRRALEHPNWDAPKEHKRYDAKQAARESIELTLREAVKSIDVDIHTIGEGEEGAKWIHIVRSPLHELVNQTIKLRKEFDKKREKS